MANRLGDFMPNKYMVSSGRHTNINYRMKTTQNTPKMTKTNHQKQQKFIESVNELKNPLNFNLEIVKRVETSCKLKEIAAEKFVLCMQHCGKKNSCVKESVNKSYE